MAHLLQMPNRRSRHYRVAIRYHPQRSLFTVVVSTDEDSVNEVRERPSLSEVIADLQCLGVSQEVMKGVVRRFAVERNIVIEDVLILDNDLMRFRKRQVNSSYNIWPRLDVED